MACSYVPPANNIVGVQTPIEYGIDPMNITCPHCRNTVRTAIKSEPRSNSWIIGGVLCLLALWPCACIPCCIDNLRNVEHTCPNCNQFLGAYKT